MYEHYMNTFWSVSACIPWTIANNKPPIVPANLSFGSRWEQKTWKLLEQNNMLAIMGLDDGLSTECILIVRKYITLLWKAKLVLCLLSNWKSYSRGLAAISTHQLDICGPCFVHLLAPLIIKPWLAQTTIWWRPHKWNRAAQNHLII